MPYSRAPQQIKWTLTHVDRPTVVPPFIWVLRMHSLVYTSSCKWDYCTLYYIYVAYSVLWSKAETNTVCPCVVCKRSHMFGLPAVWHTHTFHTDFSPVSLCTSQFTSRVLWSCKEADSKGVEVGVVGGHIGSLMIEGVTCCIDRRALWGKYVICDI